MTKIVFALKIFNVAQTIEVNRVLLRVDLLFEYHGLFVRFVNVLSTISQLIVEFQWCKILVSVLIKLIISSLKVINSILVWNFWVLWNLYGMLTWELGQKRVVLAPRHFSVMVLLICIQTNIFSLKRRPHFEFSQQFFLLVTLLLKSCIFCAWNFYGNEYHDN